MVKLAKFNSSFLGTTSNFSENEDGSLTKKALVLVEGTHIDSKKREHKFPKDRIYLIANQSNALFEEGTRIPLLKDHKKEQDSVVGDLVSPFSVEVITQDNLPNPRHKHLIGRLGIFADELIIKSKDAIKQAKEGLLQTISPGIDVVTNTIREISFTPTPAITGLSVFKMADFNSNALTFEDLDNEDGEMQQLEDEYRQLTEKLWLITSNIQQSDDQELEGMGADRMQLQSMALDEFYNRFMELIGMNEQDEQTQQQQDPRLTQQNQGYPNQRQPQQNMNYSDDLPIAAFSMADMERINLAEFGYRQAFTGAWKGMRSGQNMGKVAGQFGRKMYNATRGKIAAVGRFGQNISRSFSNKPRNGVKLSQNQMNRASKNINKAGGVYRTNVGKQTFGNMKFNRFDNIAEFGRKLGSKDKKKRNRRLLMAGGGLLAGAALTGAGIYGLRRGGKQVTQGIQKAIDDMPDAAKQVKENMKNNPNLTKTPLSEKQAEGLNNLIDNVAGNVSKRRRMKVIRSSALLRRRTKNQRVFDKNMQRYESMPTKSRSQIADPWMGESTAMKFPGGKRPSGITGKTQFKDMKPRKRRS